MKHRFATDPTVGEAAENKLYEAILALRTPEEAKQFFRDLCTPTELQAMSDRWSVIGLIQQGISYRDIAEQTGVSVTTIGRVARCFLIGTGGYRLIVERLQKKRV